MLGVRGGAAEELSGADAVVVGRVEPERVGEERVADARVGVRAVADRVQVAESACADLEQADAEQHEEPDQQRMVVARDDPVVDRIFDDQRCADRAGLPEESGHDRAAHAVRLGAHDRPHKRPCRGAAYLASVHWGKVPTCQDRR